MQVINNVHFTVSPEGWAVTYKIIGMLLLCLLWVRTDSSLSGLFLILFFMIMMLLRWRFQSLQWTLFIDQFIGFAAAYLWENGSFALILNVFEAMFLGSPLLAMPSFIYGLFYIQDALLCLMLAQGLFAGLGLWGWKKQRLGAFMKMDLESKKQYELESLNNDLLFANIQVARMAELSERSRIAREIHDNAGHEIVAAYISLQTVEDLMKSDPVQAEEFFCESMKRLENGIDKIRETVHNLSPLADMGVDGLQKLCDGFTLCPVEFQVYGDASKVPVYLWSILEPCMKESLTNVMRHAHAKWVSATLDITPHIVRLSVENDGVEKNSNPNGLGLRNLQQRARAVGGNISVDTKEIFRLICVLPIQ